MGKGGEETERKKKANERQGTLLIVGILILCPAEEAKCIEESWLQLKEWIGFSAKIVEDQR